MTPALALRLMTFTLSVLAPMSDANAQVYRCGNTYSNAPCAGGKPVDTSPTLNWGGARAGATTLYLCQGYGGGRFWTREHCASREALVDRMESVPANLSFNQQVELAQSQVERKRAVAQPAPAQPGVQGTSNGDGNRSQCHQLDERVKYLDQAARAGGRAQYMDRIAHERKLARDQQFRLRC